MREKWIRSTIANMGNFIVDLETWETPRKYKFLTG